MRLIKRIRTVFFLWNTTINIIGIVVGFLAMGIAPMVIYSCHECPPAELLDTLLFTIIVFPVLTLFIQLLIWKIWNDGQRWKAMMLSFIPSLHLLLIQILISWAEHFVPRSPT